MLNKKLLALLGNDKKNLFVITLLNVLSLLLNIIITASICYMMYLAYIGDFKILPYILISLTCLSLRFLIIKKVGKIKSDLGSKIKLDFRKKSQRKYIHSVCKTAKKVTPP